jgi:DNA polymerase-3 subunit alpha
MVKIISRKLLGIQPVYDIGVASDHNFLLANGLVASNCFNKSHSTAYAYVTYQTAYLKANYPVEYMAALLTASSDNQEKVEKYRENCQKMEINVEPPDINRSQKNFTPDGDNILFGLSAVRNLGEGAIENIIKAREESGGKFKSFADFCLNVNLRVVNSRALETLIYSGAFDSIAKNRKQLINDLELVVNWAQSRNKDREIGQINIFDVLSNDTSETTEETFKDLPATKPVEDFSTQEKLKLEKEHLGFYVSDHPLKSMQEAAKILSPINLNQLSEQKTKQKISAVVILTAVKSIVTKQGKQMAFLQMEDVSGQAEGVVFADTYEQIKPILERDARLIIWGKVDKREDKFQIIVENVEIIENAKMVMLELSFQEAISSRVQHDLKSILQERSGEKNKAKVPVVAIIGQGMQRHFVRFGQDFWVQDEKTTIEALNNAGFRASAQSLIMGKA